jgi:1,4-alpha-glucan branching enzyme
MIKREISKKDKNVKGTFIQPTNGSKQTVSVVGDFNNWDPAKGKLARRSNGTSSYSVTLEPGKSYRFRYYAQDGRWFNDEAADAYEPNGLGEEDCVIHT